ncbi:MAG: hypothetical protein JRH07_09850 [Deltaproteobacteria bacterium]|nr:hypothetical protein [Deltaproteobacteria bacterium]
MIKEISFFDFSKTIPYEETDRWFFEQHSRLAKKLPHLIKYVSYRALYLPENDFFPAPQFQRMEELWWPDRKSFEIAQASDERRDLAEDVNDPKRGPRIVNLRRAVLEKEINVLHPEMTGNFQMTMNELNGKPHVKTLWAFNYLNELGLEKGEDWYLNHHTLVAARNFNLVRYVTYTPADGLGLDHGFVRFTELCWRDWEATLNDFESPRGREVLEDNKNERGIWRLITKTALLGYPHVVGNEAVFI